MKSLVLYSLFLVAVFLPACGKSKSSKKPGPQISRYFTHGNPEELIAGSTRVEKSFLNLDNLDQFQDFQLTGGSSFTQRSPRQEFSNWKDLEEENSTELPDDATFKQESPITWRFDKRSSNSYVLKETRGARPQFLSFKLIEGELQLDSMNDIPLKLKHYSVKKDKKAFSFLFTFEDPEFGQTLLALTFAVVSKELNELERIGDFSFLVDNFAIKWADPISIDATGPLSETVKSTIKQSLASWFGPASDSAREEVKLSFSPNFPPFSDLNHHGITIVPSFRAESGENYFVAGVTLPVIDNSKGTFIDSDIFIFAANNRRPYSGQSDHTIAHELGHFFGLGHEFAKSNTGASLYSSVMAYSNASEMVSERDRAAIRALYDKDLGPSQP